MRQITRFEELHPGDKVKLVKPVHKWIGGPLDFPEGTELTITKVDENSCQAGPEGGKLVGHIFVGLRELNALRLLQSMQTDSRKVTATTKTNRTRN